MYHKEEQFISPDDLRALERTNDLLQDTPPKSGSETLNSLVAYIAIFLYAFTVFAVDLALKQGIAAGVPYMFAVWIAYHAPRPATLWITAAGCSILTILGVVLSTPDFETTVVIINRALAMFAIWGTALLCWQVRQTREHLAEREQQVRHIIQSAPTAMLMTDEEGRIVLGNSEALQLFGYSREELLGQSVDILVPESQRSQHPQQRHAFMQDPSDRAMGAGRDLHALRKDGTEVAVEVGLTPIRHQDRIYVLSSIVDISHRKALEDRLRTVNAELERRVDDRTAKLQAANEALLRSNVDLQQFAYIASHDLQTPLRGISGFVQLLESEYADKLDPQARDWIQRTVDNTRRMHTLINDLLAYSRVDSRARPFETISLEAVVDDIVALLDTELKAANGQVTHAALPTVRGDRSQLSQLMENLIGNGLKYHGAEPPKVHISAQLEGEEWTIAVRDNGIGIDPKHHERIFEIFKRLHTNQTYPGTGIGLAVCRRVVHRHGGRIWLESKPGEGSTFYFTIPNRE